MDHKEAHHLRLYVLAALFFIVAAVYIGVLYDTQVNNYDYYYASSVRSIARSETVEAARGNITDRNGKVLVSSRSSYNLTFDASLLEKDEDANESLLRLLQLCQSRGINWVDSLPISRSAPFAYTIDSLDSAARSRFLTYLKDLDEAANALAAYLLAPTDGSYELDKVAARYFSGTFPPAKNYLGTKVWQKEETVQTALDTLAHHTALLQALWGLLSQQLEELDLKRVYEEIELPLCPVLAEMEQAGVLVDVAALEQFGQTLRAGIAQRQQAVFDLAGEEFNLNSTQQLGQVLFDHLGLPPVKKTKTGYSTSAEVLEKLRDKHPIVDQILEYRQLTKLNSTYVEGLEKVIAPDGRIHTCFQNTVTATGRLSSTEPNLQNIPVRTPLGAQMRTMFIARPGWVLVDADYSQIELRLLAHMAGDEKMIAAFQSGQDIHAQTASQVFGLPPEEITGELRRRAKAVNFGIVYGISGFSLAQDIGVTRQEAADYMEKYLETFSGVKQYMYHVKEQAHKDGYVAPLMGRRRWLPELKSSNYNLRSFGERVALNMPIQGTAADVMKLAMIRVARRLKAEGLQAQLILQVHDELIVECPQAEQEQVKALLAEEMQAAGTFSVPLVAEAGAGRSWAEAKG